MASHTTPRLPVERARIAAGELVYHPRARSKEKVMCRGSIVCVAAAILALFASSSNAADVAAGKAAAQAQCVQCHEADDWEGESAASLESLIHDIVAGKVKHKNKLQLSDADVANIAAYWGQTGKAR